VPDGKFVASNTAPDVQVDCQNGCSIDVPAPGLAVVFLTNNTQKASSAVPTGRFSIWPVLLAALVGVAAV